MNRSALLTWGALFVWLPAMAQVPLPPRIYSYHKLPADTAWIWNSIVIDPPLTITRDVGGQARIGIVLPSTSGAPQSSYSGFLAPYCITSADLNDDGSPDLIVVDNGQYPNYVGRVGVMLGSATGFSVPTFYPVGVGAASVIVADMNADGKQDVIVLNWSGSISVLMGSGNGTLQTATSYPVSALSFAVAVGDFNGDGRTDVVIGSASDGQIYLLAGNGDGTLGSPVSVGMASNPQGIVARDLNGDGRIDLAVANLSGFSVFLGNGNGSFGAPTYYPTGSVPYSIAAADFNGDGKIDMVVSNLSSGTVAVSMGNGDGTFSNPYSISVGSNPESIAVGDFNGDGKQDVAVAVFGDAPGGSGGSAVILFGNGDGTFQGSFSMATDKNPFSLSASGASLYVANVNSGDITVIQRVARTVPPIRGPVPVTSH